MVARPKPFLGVVAMGCFACGRGFHRECARKKGCKTCHPKQETEPQTGSESGNAHSGTAEPKSAKRHSLKDPESTGRKRAAKLYPIESESPCEWRGKKNCGGGLRPIIGCYDGNQQHRHHGPVKRTTRNELGNVHRICDNCHVHWHELNDLIYEEAKFNLLPHEPVEATDVELMQNVLEWKSGEMGRKFELASSRNKAKSHERTA